MRRLLSIAVVALAAGSVIFARGGMQAPEAEQPAEKKLIDLKSDNMGPVAPGDSVIFLVGNFAAQHNGAVITCDSAVRYSDMRIEFFGNVLINKNTTYIYGDRAEYNGEVNEARVFSDIVKVVDEDATLYTYEFLFNTKENVGEFGGGGVLVNRDSRLESVRGYYYANSKELVCVDRVEMRNDEYELKGDSVVYNMATDNAFFFKHTNIWNKEGDYLYADRGAYRKADSLYKVTSNGYVLTDKQEMWSDSIDFYRAEDHIILWRDIQIDDTEHKVLAFGDYGEYWKEPGNAFLTRRPSIVSYDLSQGDSLFMRADSMFLFTINENAERRAAEAAAADSLARSADSLALSGPDSLAHAAGGADVPADSLGRPRSGRRPQGVDAADSLATAGSVPDSLAAGGDADSPHVAPSPLDAPDRPAPADSLGGAAPADSLANAADTLTVAQRKALLKEAAKRAKAEEKAAAAKEKKKKLDEIAARRKEKTTARLLEQKEREEARLTARRLKAESKLKARQARATRKGRMIQIDSTALRELDSLIVLNMAEQDSLLNLLVDSLLTDTAAMAIPADSIDSLAAPRDSIYRLLKGFRNVKIYRSDFQTVCDSMTAISTDSTIHLYIDPVLWNENNQITSDVMDIFTENQQLTRAEFIGSPMMVSQLDTTHYNQVAGKTMTAYFFNNQIYRNDVNGNAQTIYYMQDGEPVEITMMGVIESGEISFFIEDKQVVQITYRGDPVYNFYPMDKIPPTQDIRLKGFKWEGARRPSQAEVFDRRIRPSERERRSEMKHPDFPIMQRIDEHRKRLIEQRRWTDRNDQVDAATVEWMHSLGYEVGQPRKTEAPAE
ncbi:OstA-like protein [uncultured Alistipes sp.]|uniref:OstA-like protein n=1 Tax=uncultured Alistipes sp. TaxID=538949 RepID=UPI002586C058|nr:OstA-like protein [uncultured Alistipes sp.]